MGLADPPRPGGGAGVLYLSYDGMTDPIGRSQVMPYLLGCAAAGHSIELVSFEKAEPMERLGPAIAKLCEDAGIAWRPERFHEHPPVLAKAIDQWLMRKAALRSGVPDLIHARSYVSARAALAVKERTGAPFLFDMRGFWPDQRREGGRWPDSSPLGRALYRRWKALERQFVAAADHIVVLSEAARDEIRRWPAYRGGPISVVPCCADFELFQPIAAGERLAVRSELGLAPDALVLGYVGSLGTVYLLDELVRLFAAVRARENGARLLLVGQDRPDAVLESARRQGHGLPAESLCTVVADRQDMPRYIGAMDVGTTLITPTYSSLGVSPTKLAEYLSCGIPVIGNRGVGDVERLLTDLDAGHVLPDFSEPAMAQAAQAVVRLAAADRHGIRSRSRTLLDLPEAVGCYDAIYRDLGRACSLSVSRS